MPQDIIRPGRDENILWEGTPDRRVSVFEGIFNPMLPFALIWGLTDLTMFTLPSGSDTGVSKSIFVFFALHMMPVWIYIIGALTAGIKASHTRFMLTDRALYIQRGIFTINVERSPLNEIMHTAVHVGIIDRMFGTGDVITECVHDIHKIENIRDYTKVCDMIAQVSQDQYTDTMYPNDKRPGENHGYNTRYTGKWQ